jgi:peptidoglycan/LPS O-acetylase OafA/YrhL
MTKKLTPLLLFPLLFLASCVVNGSGTPYYYQPVYVGPGVGLGTIIAVVVSWNRNKSILWAIIHGILGWIYVIYAIIVPKR